MPTGPADDAALRSPHGADATSPGTAGLRFSCLEGVRALAASMVVVHHVASQSGTDQAGPLATPAGVMDAGVAIFFVLSGFLIYRPFAAAHLAGGSAPSAVGFWRRRIVRIVPAYWAALSIMWALGWFELGRDWWRYYLFLQIYDVYTTLGGIVAAWSLNTEMAFYLLIPIWSLVLRRVVYRGRPARLWAEIALVFMLGASAYVSRALISSTERVWAVSPSGTPVTMREVSFSWLPNNLDLFATGMLLAVLSVRAAKDADLQSRLDRVSQPAWAWWAGATLLFGWFAYRVGPPSINGGYQGWYWQQRQLVLAVIGGCLLLPTVFGAQDRGRVRGMLRWGPVAWVGMLSYGLYLWHQNLLAQIPVWLDEPASSVPFVLALAATFVLGLTAALISWYGLEQPFQRWARRRF